jgi:hypothetical protein
MIVLGCLLCIIYQAVHSLSYGIDIEGDICDFYSPSADDESLNIKTARKNILFNFNGNTKCFVDKFGVATSQDSPHNSHILLVSPRAQEVESFVSLPRTKTFASLNFSFGLVDGVSAANLWIQNKKAVWTLPPNHPRQNKSKSVYYAKQAEFEPTSFYSHMKSGWVGSSLVIVNGGAYVAQTSVVVTQSCPKSWFQLRQACGMHMLSAVNPSRDKH